MQNDYEVYSSTPDLSTEFFHVPYTLWTQYKAEEQQKQYNEIIPSLPFPQSLMASPFTQIRRKPSSQPKVALSETLNLTVVSDSQNKVDIGITQKT